MAVELTKTPSFRLDGKRALVTGAGRGIGLAAASALADAGAHVTLAARTREEIEAAAAAIRARGQKAEAVARRLVAARQPGSIVNISSQMGHVGAAKRTVYCASKHAMEGFTKAMAIELAPHDIRVNTIGPTFIETPLTRPFFENEAFKQEVLSKIKLGRIGQMDELTGAIVFLASDASRLMTGSALVVDGGWTAE